MARLLACVALFAGGIALAGPSVPREEPESIDFQRDVRPILSDNCFACHGPDDGAREAELRLDAKEFAFADLGGYFAIEPGDLEASELWYRISTDLDADRMPPPESGRSLAPEEIELVRRWIEEGAVWEDHWAFVAPRRAEPPAVRDTGWPRDDLDRFVLARLEEEGLAPSPEASRETLIRRLTLDLNGLPPTPEEVDAYLADGSPDAYETVVERLLASPRFGERMALPWLDAARYADTNGYHRDASRTMWLWREWLIDALNANKPYDEFLVEQLAGDFLPEPTVDQLIATGFNRNHMLNDEGGAIPEEYQVEYVVDRVRTTSTVFLGLTMGCAQCHDHKYDPITQEEYYRFYAFFNRLPEKGLDGSNGPAEPKLVVPREEDEAEIAAVEAEAEELRAELAAPNPELDAREAEWIAATAAELDERWETLEPEFLGAGGGATLTPLGDGSVLAGGANPGIAYYEIEGGTDAGAITALWLEVLGHESLVEGATGRTTHGNWVLSELEVEARSAVDPTQRKDVTFSAASADYSQKGYAVGKAIDGDAGTGWAVDGHVLRENRNALFLPSEPFGFEGGTVLRVRMRQDFGYQHAIGRFRLSVSADPAFAADGAPAELGAWSLLGPVTGNADELFARAPGTERGVIEAGYGDQEVAWVERPDFVDGRSHPLEGTNSAFYLLRAIDSPTARTLSLSLGSDDSIVVWLNGERVLYENAKRGVAADQELVDVQLRAGTNELLMKIVNYGGPAGFYFRVIGEGPPVLPGDVTAAVQTSAGERSEEQAQAIRDLFRRRHMDGWSHKVGRIDDLEARVGEIRVGAPALMVMRDEPGVRMTKMLERGRYDRPGRGVTAGTPAFLPPLAARVEGGEPDRLDLARWMVDPEHPLTARVAVSRVWQTLFGVGLVETTENFGSQGAWPEHKELLDFLARELVDDGAGGWDVKALVRRIVTSSTYRQSSAVTLELLERDPRNRLYARAPSFRLPAELVRDSALHVSGLLTERRGGPSVKPYQPAGLWAEVSFNDQGQKDSDFYVPDSGDGLYRRSMYTFWKRSLPPPNMQTFDAPTREVCVVRRDRTNTPLQALVLLNDPTFVEAARVFAQRMLHEEGDDDARIATAFRRATSRRPEADEVALLSDYLDERRAAYRADPEAAAALLSTGESARDESIDRAEHAAWTALASLILNLDETITRR